MRLIHLPASVAVILAMVVSCNPPSGPGSQCSTADDCDGGQICVDAGCMTLCSTNAQCDPGFECSREVCVPGNGDNGGNGAPPVILNIDGTASVDNDATHTDHRMNDRIVITGTGLEGATALLTGTNPTTDSYTLVACETGTDTQMILELPAEVATDLAGLTQGEYALSVTNQAGSCNAELWLLQGEVGTVGNLNPPLTVGAVTITSTGLEVLGPVDASGFTIRGTPIETQYWSRVDSDLTYEPGHVGMGTLDPTANLTVRGTLSSQLTGIVSTAAGSTTVNGSGTVFTAELLVGDAIMIGGDTFTVGQITDDVTLVVDVAPTTGVSDADIFTDSELLSVQNGNGVAKLHMDNSGRLGINTKSLAGHLTIAGSGNLINLTSGAPTIKFTDATEDDYWIHANNNRLYFLWDEGDDGDWNSPHPLYFEGRTANFGGDVNVTGALTAASVNVRLTCETILTTTTTTGTHTVSCPAGHIATGSGWEPGSNWDTSASHRVINGTDTTGCSFYIGGMVANWRTSCTCCAVVSN